MSSPKTYIIPFDVDDPRLNDHLKHLKDYMVSPEMLIDNCMRVFLHGGSQAYTPLMEYICDYLSQVYATPEQYDIELIETVEVQQKLDAALELAQESSMLLSEIIHPVLVQIAQESRESQPTNWEVKRVGKNTFAIVVGGNAPGRNTDDPADRTVVERCHASARKWFI